MTKCLVLTLFLFLGVYSVKSAAINEKHGSNVDELIRDFLERKCIKNANVETFEELESEVYNVLYMCGNQFPRSRTSAEYYNSMCITRKNYKCLVNLQEKIDPCFDSEEKYLKDFGLSTYNASIDYFCKDGEEAFADIQTNLRQSIGVCSNLREFMRIETNPCLSEIYLELSNNADLVITKSYLCSKLQEVGECLVDGVKKRCSDDGLPNYVRDGMQLYLNWCVENNSRK